MMAGKKVYFTGNDEGKLEGLVETFNGGNRKYACESVKSLYQKQMICALSSGNDRYDQSSRYLSTVDSLHVNPCYFYLS